MVPPPVTCESALGAGSQYSASSEWNGAHGANNARLHHQAGGGKTGAWSSRHNSPDQWLQITFRKVAKVTRVATQGRTDHSQWVTTYRLAYSLDGIFYQHYGKVSSLSFADRITRTLEAWKTWVSIDHVCLLTGSKICDFFRWEYSVSVFAYWHNWQFKHLHNRLSLAILNDTTWSVTYSTLQSSPELWGFSRCRGTTTSRCEQSCMAALQVSVNRDSKNLLPTSIKVKLTCALRN